MTAHSPGRPGDTRKWLAVEDLEPLVAARRAAWLEFERATEMTAAHDAEVFACGQDRSLADAVEGLFADRAAFADPPDVALMRRELAAWDRGETNRGSVGSTFYDRFYKALFTPFGDDEREPRLLRLSSYCGGEPSPAEIIRLEIRRYAGTITMKPLGPLVDALTVVADAAGAFIGQRRLSLGGSSGH